MACVMFVFAEVYWAGASVRGHLQRVIQACSRGACNFGLGLYDVLSCICFNSAIHGLADEIRPAVPRVLVATTLHTNENTQDARQTPCLSAFFYFATAKQGLGIAVHVLLRRHANWP